MEYKKEDAIKDSTKWYMENKGYSEHDARLAAEAQYDLDRDIFMYIDSAIKFQEQI